MFISKFIITALLIFHSFIVFGSCSGPFYSITELLNHNQKDYNIFTCRILKTYINGYDWESIAVVEKIYEGTPRDTIFINTGGSTTAGGEKLIPNSQWLIFSPTKDGLNYHATVCDHLSSLISDGGYDRNVKEDTSLAKIYLDILNEYENIVNSKFTGYKELIGNGKLVAKGQFIDGKPDGNWIHYSRYRYFKRNVIKSKISYKHGLLDGMYDIYSYYDGKYRITERRKYKEDLLVFIEIHSTHFFKKEYKYIDGRKRLVTSTKLDSVENIIEQTNTIEIDYNSKKYSPIYFKHGYYINKYRSYLPLAEGYYFKGARIGIWKFFDSNGDKIETKVYPDKIDEVNHFQTYDDFGNIRVSGLYKGEKRTGVWKYYYDNKLFREKIYDINGEIISELQFSNSKIVRITPYRNSKKHGQEIRFNRDGTVKSITNYKYGNLNGIKIIFDSNGNIEDELMYIDSRKNSILKSKNEAYYINGFLNGHFVTYHNTGEKYLEGEIWNGYRIGEWYKYNKDGTFRKMYYMTNKSDLMNLWYSSQPILTEIYDKEGVLIKSWKN